MSPQKRRNIGFLVALAILVVLSSFGLGAGTSSVSSVATTAGHFTGKPGAVQSGASAAQKVSAQQKPSTTTGVRVVNQVSQGVSAPLRSLPVQEAYQGKVENDAAGLTKGRTDSLPAQPKEAYNVEPKVPNVMPTPINTFEGINNRNGVLPPDSDGAVGPNHFVEWINLSLQVYDKNGNSLMGPINGNQIFAGLPASSLCRSTNNGDPIVLYDELAGRWLLSQFAFTSAEQPTDECIAISQTGDPTGAYWLYDFVVDPSNLADYPHFGVWPDGYYMTVNLFTPISNNWVGSGQVVFDRARMLNGQAATAQVHNILGLAEWGGMMPADFDGSTPPPAGAPNYLLEVTDDQWYPGVYTDEIQYYKFHVDWTTPGNTTFTGPIHIPVAAFDGVPCSSANVINCVPQPGTSQKLQSNWDRVMWRLAYRNFGDHQSLVFNQAVDADGTGTGHTAIRWYELRTPETPTVYQYGTYAPDANARWMASAGMDRQGNLAIGFSESNGTNLYPSIYYAGRLAGDPSGQLAQGEALMFTGSGSQTSTFGRWGDYSELTVDPTDDCTFWYINQYLSSTSNASWRTRFGSFKFAGCSATPPTHTPTPTQTVTSVPTNTRTATPSGTPATATPTVTPCPINFSDVHTTDYFYEPVRYLFCMGAISGYSDGTFRPFNNTTRGQLSKIIVLAEGWAINTTGGPHFSDVPTTNPFYTYIETAYNHGIISGYSDGTFRWGNNVTRGQLSKIVVSAEGWAPDLGGAPHFTDVAPGSAFYTYVETAYNHGIISGYADGTFRPNANATRGQISKIVYLAVTGAR